MKELIQALVKLVDLKSIVTLILNVAMVLLLSGLWKPSAEVLALFSTAYGSVMTYYFTKKA